DFPRPYLLDLHAARKLAGAKPDEGNTVPMIRVHIRLNLENKRRHIRLSRRHRPFVGRLCARRRRHRGERIEQIADAEILERAAEEDRGHVALGKSSRVKLLAGVAYEVELPCELSGIEFRVQSGNFGNGHLAQSASG